MPMNNTTMSSSSSENKNRYTACAFCGELYWLDAPDGQRHYQLDPSGCPNPPPYDNPDDEGRYTCYTCGEKEGTSRMGKKIKNQFTPTQRSRGIHAQCKDCTATIQTERFRACDDIILGDEYKINSLGQDLLAHCNWVYYDPEHMDEIEDLLEKGGADPNYIPQAVISDPNVPQYVQGRRLYYHDGTRYLDLRIAQPTRPLLRVIKKIYQLVGIRREPYVAGGMDEYYCNLEAQCLRVIALLLINAGAEVSSAIEYFCFDLLGGRDLTFPAELEIECLLYQAWNSVQDIVHMCQQDPMTLVGEGNHQYEQPPLPFDFVRYIQQNEGRYQYRQYNSDDPFLPLTEKAIRASSEIRPYYDRYTFQRLEARLLSHRSCYFDRPRQLDGGLYSRNADGTDDDAAGDDYVILPALPKGIEVQILTLAFLSMPKPIFATQIPDPIVM